MNDDRPKLDPPQLFSRDRCPEWVYFLAVMAIAGVAIVAMILVMR